MTDNDLGNPHISFSEMWGLLKGGSRVIRKLRRHQNHG
jgi:hypothetical protein